MHAVGSMGEICRSEGQAVKRARVHIRIQGEHGRVVREENYLVPVRDGEQLAYEVRVQPSTPQSEMGAYAEEALRGQAMNEGDAQDQGGQSAGASSSTSPLMGNANENEGMLDLQIWSTQQQTGRQDKGHIDPEEFAATPIGKKFYQEWKAGRVGPQVIGSRFGCAWQICWNG